MSSAQFLFDRDWAVTVGFPGDTGYKYTQIKTTFDIAKSSFSTPNKSKIELWNLNTNSRLTFQKKGLQIKLDAGYKNLIETLFLGDVVRVETQRKGADIVTTFECGDGERQLVNAHFSKSYPPGIKYVQIIQDVATALGVNIGTVIGIQDQTYNSGVSFSTSARHVLDKLLPRQGLEWSVQNGYLQIIPIKAHNGDDAVVISKSTGMIGVPSQKESGVEFTALLNPRLVPGAPVQIISEVFTGFYKIRCVQFEGDSHGEKWQAKCEAVPISAAQTLPANAGTKFATIGQTA